jgi:Sec-independent protein translocase protein TatA
MSDIKFFVVALVIVFLVGLEKIEGIISTAVSVFKRDKLDI